MVLKRPFSEGFDDGSENPRHEPRQRLATAIDLRDAFSGTSFNEFAQRLEPFFRRVVREEVIHSIQQFCPSSTRSSFNQVESSDVRAWHLRFVNKLSSTLFTNSKVESEDCEPIKIVLVDTYSKQIITCGPLSSVKIEIVVLDGDFVAGEGEDWTQEDFDACVIREREGKRPLVTGDLIITLRNGVAELDNICFTDNSSWIRSRRFRLGARVQGISTDRRVREAKSEAFIVKDHRGESYKKHHPPSLDDEVWRLERIAKDGAFHKRLALNGISTVEDLLRLYVTDSSSLRNVLGGGISNKTWDTITEHATTCVLDDRMYLYNGAVESVVLVFNSIWKVIGAIFNGQDYQSMDKLDMFQMRLVEDVKRQAYSNLHQLVPFSGQSIAGSSMILSSMQAELLSCPTVGLHNVSTPPADQDLQMQLSNRRVTSQSCTFEVNNDSQLEVPLSSNCYSMQAFSPTLRNSFVLRDFCCGSYGEEYNAAPSGSLESIVTTAALPADDISQDEMPLWQGNGFFFAPSNQSLDIFSSNLGFHFSRNGKPKARWCKVRAAIKWGISVRRDVAAKKTSRLLCYDF